MTKLRRAELLLLSVTVIWGSTFVITKALLESNPPFWYTALRFFLSALIVFIVFPRRMMHVSSSALRHGTILGVFLFIGFATQTVGLQFTSASKSAFFTGMLVVLTPIVHYCVQDWLGLERKLLRIGNVLGVFCAAAGLYLLTSPAGGGFNVGDALTLVCALMFACYIVYLDYASGVPDRTHLTFVMFLVCGFLGLVSAIAFEPIGINLTWDFSLGLLYLTIFATVIAMGIQNRYQGDTSPTRAAVIFALEPVIAAVFAYIVGGEELGIPGILGGGIIILGLLLSEFSEELPLLKIGLRRTPTS